MLIQPIITILSLIAILSVLRRFKHGALSQIGLMFWLVLWVAIGALVWIPQFTNRIAAFLGVGRGADAIFYISITILFYAIFRLYGKMENLEHKINELVKKIALRDIEPTKQRNHHENYENFS